MIKLKMSDDDDLISRLNKKRKLEKAKSVEYDKKIKTLESEIAEYKEKQKLADDRIKILEVEVKNKDTLITTIESNLDLYIQKDNLRGLQVQYENLLNNTISDTIVGLEQKIHQFFELYVQKIDLCAKQEKQLILSQFDLENYGNKYRDIK